MLIRRFFRSLRRLFRLPANQLGVMCIWTFRENGVVVAQTKNVFTDFGLTALASALSGGYTPPIYLVLDSGGTTLFNTVSPGQTSVVTNLRVDLSGDTQLVLSPGKANQEVVTFTGTPTGSGPYTYTLTSAAAQLHNSGDTVVRQTRHQDTMSTVLSEIEYDHADFPNQRAQSYAGYSQGTGNWVMQFYILGTQAITNLNYVGLADNITIGQGSLHDHAVLGYTHTSNNDVEIDVSLTLTNV
jgi:hypothetical protein